MGAHALAEPVGVAWRWQPRWGRRQQQVAVVERAVERMAASADRRVPSCPAAAARPRPHCMWIACSDPIGRCPSPVDVLSQIQKTWQY